MGPDVYPGSRPHASVRAGDEQFEGYGRERGEHGLNEFAADTVLRAGPVHAVQQLRGGDCGDPDLLGRSELSF